jgi:hypothetical protein
VSRMVKTRELLTVLQRALFIIESPFNPVASSDDAGTFNVARKLRP